jgi:hypothetical protein
MMAPTTTTGTAYSWKLVAAPLGDLNPLPASIGELPSIRIPRRHPRLKIRMVQRLLRTHRQAQQRQFSADRRDLALEVEPLRLDISG